MGEHEQGETRVVVLPGPLSAPGPAALQAVLAEVSDVGVLCAPDGRLRYATDSLAACLGLLPDEVVGQDCLQLVHPGDRSPTLRGLQALVRAGAGARSSFELRLRHADGSWRWVQGTAVNRLATPEVGAVVVTLSDVSGRRAAEAALDELAGTDGLTGLPNRSTLRATLDAAFAAGRVERTAVVAVELVDLGGVNEALGHAVVDQLLVELAGRLVRVAGDRGFAARLAVDRFGVLLSDADADLATAVMAEAQAAVAAAVPVAGRRLRVTARTGGALGPAADGGALLTAAEAALQRAGEGQQHLARPHALPAAAVRDRLVHDLRRGMERDELVVHYQPVVDLQDGRPLGAEALVRWAHPVQGLLSPAAFLGAAEDSGAVVELGRRVLREACRAAAGWPTLPGQPPLPVSVNVSPRQLLTDDLVGTVQQALADTGLPPSSLVLEVTETAMMGDLVAVAEVLRAVRRLGVGIAADDFGTGYSSLSHARQLPLTSVKIDRSFVGGLGREDGDAAVVSSLLSLAAGLGLSCVAEGVETEQQRLVLRTLGCVQAQGFLFCRPLDAPGFTSWLEGVTAADQLGARSALARARQLRAAGCSTASVAAALNSEGRTTSAGRRWSSRSVALLLEG